MVDSVADYLELMKEIFDFESIKNLLQGNNQKPLKVLINSMHGGELLLYLFKLIINLRQFYFSDWTVCQAHLLR